MNAKERRDLQAKLEAIQAIDELTSLSQDLANAYKKTLAISDGINSKTMGMKRTRMLIKRLADDIISLDPCLMTDDIMFRAGIKDHGERIKIENNINEYKRAI
ncbi:hypothetical protein ACQ1R0_03895 [Ornithobacterium rhinotracheale]|uniref:hypothetical protein n=1 Tax=Ornithobacterium rhinotracheale TaxID=28251 RepID=UPI004036F6AB